jgi:hypothetical protein
MDGLKAVPFNEGSHADSKANHSDQIVYGLKPYPQPRAYQPVLERPDVS